MRNRSNIVEQKVRSWTGANNLPGATAIKPGWDFGDMALAKLISWQHAVTLAGSEDVLVGRTDWARGFGITGKGLLAEVRRCVPGFDRTYENSKPSRVGASDADKAADLYNRLWYMYRERVKKGKTKKVYQRISVEHPQRSLMLRPYVPLAIKLYHMGPSVALDRELKASGLYTRKTDDLI